MKSLKRALSQLKKGNSQRGTVLNTRGRRSRTQSRSIQRSRTKISSSTGQRTKKLSTTYSKSKLHLNQQGSSTRIRVVTWSSQTYSLSAKQVVSQAYSHSVRQAVFRASLLLQSDLRSSKTISAVNLDKQGKHRAVAQRKSKKQNPNRLLLSRSVRRARLLTKTTAIRSMTSTTLTSIPTAM